MERVERRGRPDPNGFVLDTSDAILDAQADIRQGALLIANGYRKLIAAQQLLFACQDSQKAVA